MGGLRVWVRDGRMGPADGMSDDDTSPPDCVLEAMMAIMARREGDTTSTIDDALRDGPAIVSEITAEIAAERWLPEDWLKQIGDVLVPPTQDIA